MSSFQRWRERWWSGSTVPVWGGGRGGAQGRHSPQPAPRPHSHQVGGGGGAQGSHSPQPAPRSHSHQVGVHQRWASHKTQASQSNARHRSYTRHSIERSEISYFFEKLKAKIVPSTPIVFNRWRTRFLGIKFFTFNEKKIETYTLIFRNV